MDHKLNSILNALDISASYGVGFEATTEDAQKLRTYYAALEAENAQLTRERDAARKSATAWKTKAFEYKLCFTSEKMGCDEASLFADRMEEERDAALNELARVRDLLNQAHAERDSLRGELGAALSPGAVSDMTTTAVDVNPAQHGEA